MPEEWIRQVQTWSRLLRARRGDVEGTAPPDHNDEYLFYQLLVGTWPVELLDDVSDAARRDSYVDRLKATMVKSMREAKVHSTWAAPDEAYEEAMTSFVQGALDLSLPTGFLDSFLPFARDVARLGAHNSLVQTVLKLTSPGVPDIYQGSELWDLSMVDPDNRRPVDYGLRNRVLDEVLKELADDRPGAVRRFAQSWPDGRLKLSAIATLLGYRRVQGALFAEGTYEIVTAEGPEADQICAFLRQHDDQQMLTAVVRFPARTRGKRAFAGERAAASRRAPRDGLEEPAVRGRACAGRSAEGNGPVRNRPCRRTDSGIGTYCGCCVHQ